MVIPQIINLRMHADMRKPPHLQAKISQTSCLIILYCRFALSRCWSPHCLHDYNCNNDSDFVDILVCSNVARGCFSICLMSGCMQVKCGQIVSRLYLSIPLTFSIFHKLILVDISYVQQLVLKPYRACRWSWCNVHLNLLRYLNISADYNEECNFIIIASTYTWPT